MDLNIDWGDDFNIDDYNLNNTDANRKGFFLTPLQVTLYDINDESSDAVKLDASNKVFKRAKIDAIKLINFYTHNRIELLPNGFASLNANAKKYFTLALYKQIEFTQYNLGNVVEVQQSVQYSQGTQTNIAISPSSSIFASDKLTLEAQAYIDFTGILANVKSIWWKLITDEPL